MRTFYCLGCLLALGTGAAGPAFAQQQAIAPAQFDLFEGDHVDPRPDGFARLADAIRGSDVPSDCPLGKLTLFVAEEDPEWQRALADSRRVNTLGALESLGLDVAGRLFVDIVFGATDGMNDTRYAAAHDDNAPALRTTSVPPKGSKVKPGDPISVTMTARDDAAQWQTGIKTIQLVADSEGGAFVGSENYAPCSDPREKRLQVSYTVPANPPPIVRLTALAEDHAGLTDSDTAEFPTGDWYGKIEWKYDHWVEATVNTSGVQAQRVGSADLVLRQKPDGTVEGRLLGTQESEEWSGFDASYFCKWRSLAPQPVSATIEGMYEQTRGHPMFQASDVQAVVVEELVDSRVCESPPIRKDYAHEFRDFLPMLVHDLVRVDDTTFTARMEIVNEGDRNWLRGYHTLTLRRVSD